MHNRLILSKFGYVELSNALWNCIDLPSFEYANVDILLPLFQMLNPKLLLNYCMRRKDFCRMYHLI